MQPAEAAEESGALVLLSVRVSCEHDEGHGASRYRLGPEGVHMGRAEGPHDVPPKNTHYADI
jgi:hypothetical protein